MAFGLTLTAAPSSEPVTVAQLKAHSRITLATEDTQLGMYITTARMNLEDWTGRSFVRQSWLLTIDDWIATPQWLRTGYPGWTYVPFTYRAVRPLLIPRPPLISV